MILTVAGHIGSGKSAVCKELVARTGARMISTGALFRGVAAQRGMTVLELNEWVTVHGGVDDEIDGYLRSLSGSTESLVIDSRLAWHFVQGSVKVYLVVDPEIAGQRVYGAERADESYRDAKAAHHANLERKRVEAVRYHKLYGVECDAWANFDLVVDTSHAPPAAIAELILREAPTASGPDVWLSPRRLVGGGAPDGEVTVRWDGQEAYVVTGQRAVDEAAVAGRPWVHARLVA